MSTEDISDAIDLPRSQEGSSPQHLLITLLGDYWLEQTEYLPSAALVRVLEEFGVSTLGARAALSRLSRRGLLETSRVGRRTFYGLTQTTARRLASGGRRIMRFGIEDGWDGTWCVVAYSVPEDRREARHVLRSRLRWLGFAPLYDGVWVSPTADPESVVSVLDELELATATILRASSVAGYEDGRAPIEAWDLQAVRSDYAQFIARSSKLIKVIGKGDVSPATALLERTQTMDVYRRFPALDPQFPLDMMPADWPRLRARDLFVSVYDSLAPLAEIRVRQMIAESDPELAGLASHRTSTQLLSIPSKLLAG